ncbi:MAG: bifunctional phosphopantothenoylcysteine decarboxylase/phosphopantothenate--cysteine ligase CoaBC [Crocinitomicaceae bacterium]|nr:bifunctional phosphopantothenoylcysteine decarboxylase/phosphopantothenate--cysteine ligase CoaBC [Crocinitomicaceae bacterium]
MAMLKGRRIILGITGSIAAYKSAFLVRELVRAGAEVRVVMTPGAREFITPLTLGTLSGNPVHSELTDDREAGTWTDHVELGLWGDVILVAPATAHTISGMVEGRGDTLLLTVLLSAKCPVVVAPAMDRDMFTHPATTSNIEKLRNRGVHVIEPDEGELASGLEGKGRLADPVRIREELASWFQNRCPLMGYRILITAGPTHEPLDAVRFIGNRSSGRQGVAIAMELARRGAIVDLIAGPMEQTADPPAIIRHDIETALDMQVAALETLRGSPPDVIIGTAAVSDVRPANPIEGKAAKVDLPNHIELVENPDILSDLNASAPDGCFKIGFALAHDDGLEAAIRKRERKGCDLIVLNSLADKGAGFGHTTNRVRFVYGHDRIDSFELKSKEAVAIDLAEVIQAKLLERTPFASEPTD